MDVELLDNREANLLRAQKKIDQQRRLIAGINMAIQYLLTADANQDAVDFALQEMAKAARADNICLFSYHEALFGGVEQCMVSGFASGEMVMQVLDDLDAVPPALPYVDRWYRELSQGKIVSGNVESYPVEERMLLESMHIRSMLLAPIFEGGPLWGFAGLFDMKSERQWSDTEKSMIMTAARGLGSFMVRLKLENERKAARKALELANVQWQNTFDTIPDMVMIVDTAHQIVQINKAAKERLGMTDDSMELGPCYMLFHNASHPPEGCPHSAMLADEQYHETEIFVPHLNGYFHVSVNPTFDNDGTLAGAVHVARDITKRREMEEKLRYLSTHDELTQLLNRAFFEAEIESLRNGRITPISVVIADLDGLKAVNDKYGHDHGDALIKGAAQLLREMFRAGDTIVRLGGDEFAVLLKGVGEELLEIIIGRARDMLSKGDRCSAHGLPISFSIGTATTYEPERLHDAIREADLAMYDDKRKRKGD